MFGTLPSVSRDAALAAVQSLFCKHGHRLAEAARLIGGPSAEAQVVALALDLVHASRMTDRMREGLTTLHRLLMLEEVQGAYPAEAVLSGIDLGSSRIAEICLLTDLLGELLDMIPAPSLHLPPAVRSHPIRFPAACAA
jgi:hypothetical protein